MEYQFYNFHYQIGPETNRKNLVAAVSSTDITSAESLLREKEEDRHSEGFEVQRIEGTTSRCNSEQVKLGTLF